MLAAVTFERWTDVYDLYSQGSADQRAIAQQLLEAFDLVLSVISATSVDGQPVVRRRMCSALDKVLPLRPAGAANLDDVPDEEFLNERINAMEKLVVQLMRAHDDSHDAVQRLIHSMTDSLYDLLPVSKSDSHARFVRTVLCNLNRPDGSVIAAAASVDKKASASGALVALARRLFSSYIHASYLAPSYLKNLAQVAFLVQHMLPAIDATQLTYLVKDLKKNDDPDEDVQIPRVDLVGKAPDYSVSLGRATELMDGLESMTSVSFSFCSFSFRCRCCEMVARK